MAFEDIKAQIYVLLDQMIEQPEDEHELARNIHERIAELRAMGMPVPDDLKDLEKQLAERFGSPQAPG